MTAVMKLFNAKTIHSRYSSFLIPFYQSLCDVEIGEIAFSNEVVSFNETLNRARILYFPVIAKLLDTLSLYSIHLRNPLSHITWQNCPFSHKLPK